MATTADPGTAAPPRGRVARARRARRELASPLMSAPAVVVVLLAFFVPLAILIVYSFWPTIEGTIVHTFTTENYRRFFTTPTYWQSLLRSFLLVGIASAVTVALTLPFAYFVAVRVRPSRRLLWVLVATVPFFTSYLVRVFAWMNLLGSDGIINDALRRIGVVSGDIGFLNTGRVAVVITFVYLLFPLTFLTAYIALERMSSQLLEAAADLGARPWRALMGVTLPIARTGLIGGFVFSFITMMGDYITPQLIGGSSGTLFSNLIVNQFNESLQWGFGSSLALLLLVSILLMLVVLRLTVGGVESAGEYTRTFTPRRTPFLRAYALLFLVYLYAPAAVLIIFSVNDSSTIGLPFQGFTTHWISVLFDDRVLQDALQTSLTVAVVAVGISVVLGSLAAVQLSRGRGLLRNLSFGAIAMPLFLPPLVLGLAIIIGLNALGLQRGLWTIIVGHIVITLPIVVILVSVRLEGLDRNQELAALDLGARPRQAFLHVTLPQALPGIIAAAMIAFAFSMDEFIMTFLITGSQTTLPLYIYGSLRFGVSPEISAVSSLILVASFTLIVGGALIAAGRQRSAARSASAALPLPVPARTT